MRDFVIECLLNYVIVPGRCVTFDFRNHMRKPLSMRMVRMGWVVII
jgi:hypothetical protein